MEQVYQKILHEGTYERESGYGPPVDVSGCDAAVVTCGVGSVKGTNPTLDVYLQHSSDGLNWKDLFSETWQGLFSRFSAFGVHSIWINRFGRFLRVRWTLGGTDPEFSFNVTATLAIKTKELNILSAEDFFLGAQGIDGMYIVDGTTYDFPAIDLAAKACPSTVCLWNAYFPGLAGCTDEIEPENGKYGKNYEELFCGMINLKTFDIAQRYMREYNKYRGNSINYSMSSKIKFKIGQSNGNIVHTPVLCDSKIPDWSHVVLKDGSPLEKSFLGRFSVTPNDIGDEDRTPPPYPTCCTAPDDGIFNEKFGNEEWSPNLYHFVRTVIQGCLSRYGCRIFSLENELDNQWGGLERGEPDAHPDCVDDLPYSREFFNDHDPIVYAEHLMHHYMQSYFSFYHAVKDEESRVGGPELKGLPFGISNFAIGIMVVKWYFDQELIRDGIMFSNRHFSEYAVDRLRFKGMDNAYGGEYNLNTDLPPWSLSNVEEWKQDFGLAGGNNENKLAVFIYTFLDKLLEYVWKKPSCFNGLMIHLYSHWSTMSDIFNYLNDVRRGRDLPIIIEEFGNIQRFQPHDYDRPGFQCVKDIEYITGPRMETNSIEIHNTQAAETARKLLYCFARHPADDTNICGVMWEWFIKPIDYASEKAGLICPCGSDPLLPGLRFQAFEAYEFFARIFKSGYVLHEYQEEEDVQGGFTGNVVVVTFVNRDVTPRRFITTFWGYYPGGVNRIFEEEVPDDAKRMNIDDFIRQGFVGKAYVICDAIGFELESGIIETSTGNYVDISTSPRYLFFEHNIADLEECETQSFENYSHILFINNDAGQAKLNKYHFDEASSILEHELPATLESIIQFGWSNNGLLLISNNCGAHRGIVRIEIDSLEEIPKITVKDGLGEVLEVFGFVAQGNALYVAVKDNQQIPEYSVVKCDMDGEWDETYAIDEQPDVPPNQLRIGPGDVPYLSAGKIIYKFVVGTTETKFQPCLEVDTNIVAFDFAGKDHLYVICEGQKKLIVYKCDNYQAPLGDIDDLPAVPKGLRISPYYTVLLSYEDCIKEYLIKQIAPDPDYKIRNVVNGGDVQIPYGDFELTYNKKGLFQQPKMRCFMKKPAYRFFDRIGNDCFQFSIWAENLDPSEELADIYRLNLTITWSGGSYSDSVPVELLESMASGDILELEQITIRQSNLPSVDDEDCIIELEYEYKLNEKEISGIFTFNPEIVGGVSVS